MDILENIFFVQAAKILVLAFLAITFLQSSLDKIFDWNGNLSFLKEHFAKSPLASMVPPMLLVITCFELAAGSFSALGSILLICNIDSSIGLYGAEFSAVSLLMLLFGQRMAKDYEGAANLVGYFILSIIGVILFTL